MVEGKIVGKVIIDALKGIGLWAVAHPGETLDAVSGIAKLGVKNPKKKPIDVLDERVQQLGEATLGLDQKINSEIAQVKTELETLRLQNETLIAEFAAYRKSMKAKLSILGSALAAAIVVVTVLVILL